MKYKATKKEMKSNYNKIIQVGYCDLQNLLKFKDEIAYSTRSEGWACDYYDIDGVLISTGYAPIKNKNTYTNYEMIREYDNKAREITSNYDLKWEEQQKQVNELLKEFITKATIKEGK